MDRDHWAEILQVIARNPLRAVLSGIGVSWGIFMLILMIGSGNGLENGVKMDMQALSQNSMFLWTENTTMAYKGYKQGRRFRMTNEDVDFLRRTVPEVELVSPRTQLGGWRGTNNVTRNNKTGAFNIYGDTPDYIRIEPVILLQGRYMNQGDMAAKRKVVVIGEETLKILFDEGEDPIGEYISVNGVNFRVIGVFRSMKRGEDAMEHAQSIYMPLFTFQKAFNWGNTIGWLSLLGKEGISMNEVSEKVVATLKARKSVHPDDPRGFGFFTLAEEMEDMNTIFTAFDIVGFFMGFIVLLAGIIGIINIMLITVKERTKEFGIRRSVGATPTTIVMQVMQETLFLTILSGLIGMCFGVGVLELVNYGLSAAGADSGSFRQPEIGYVIVLAALGAMIFSSVIAGLLPALRAISIRPVQALRTEN